MHDIARCAILVYVGGASGGALATANASRNKSAEVWTYNVKGIGLVYFVYFLLYFFKDKFNTFYFISYDMINVKNMQEAKWLIFITARGRWRHFQGLPIVLGGCDIFVKIPRD